METKKIAGVSVNLNSKPTRKQLFESAKQSKLYYQNPNAEELINQEIEASGLYNSIPKRSKEQDKPKPDK